MDSVTDAQRTLVVGWLLVAPILLLSVFLGAVAIGRRVASPIEAARRRQVEFTADASHELRTPLSVIEAHTSLALAQDRDAEWYRTAFRRDRPRVEADAPAARGHAVARALRRGRRPSPGTSPSTSATLAAQAADRFAPVAETRQLTLTVHVPDEPIVIAASADLARPADRRARSTTPASTRPRAGRSMSRWVSRAAARA